MVAFYKHHIPDWMNGTEKLSDGAYRTYHVICQLIYLNEGSIVLNERGISGRCNQTVRAFNKHLTELIGAGKVTLENGIVSNMRSLAELERVKNNRTNATEGGRQSGKLRGKHQETSENSQKSQKTSASFQKTSASFQNEAAKSLSGHDPPEAPLQQDRSLKDKTREEKNSSSLRSEAPASPPDARTLLFRDGLSELATLTGRPETKLRAVLGKWLRDTDDDALRILTLITQAKQDRPADPIAWIEGHFHQRAAKPERRDQYGRRIG